MSQHTRPSWRVRRSWTEIFELMNVGLPNQPAAGNAGIASRLTIQRHWPGVPIRDVAVCRAATVKQEAAPQSFD